MMVTGLREPLPIVRRARGRCGCRRRGPPGEGIPVRETRRGSEGAARSSIPELEGVRGSLPSSRPFHVKHSAGSASRSWSEASSAPRAPRCGPPGCPARVARSAAPPWSTAPHGPRRPAAAPGPALAPLARALRLLHPLCSAVSGPPRFRRSTAKQRGPGTGPVATEPPPRLSRSPPAHRARRPSRSPSRPA